MSQEILVRAQALGKRFSSDRWLFRDLHFSIFEKELVALRGESGVGKSTLLNLLAGLDAPDEGEVIFQTKTIATMTDAERLAYRQRSLGFVFQAFHLLPHLTALQNVMVPALLGGMDLPTARQRAINILEKLSVAPRIHAFVGELSGGEQQRIALARALVHGPALVLADEPTGNLDPATAEQALKLLRDCCRETGASLLMVTHSSDAAKLLDRELILTRDGLQ